MSSILRLSLLLLFLVATLVLGFPLIGPIRNIPYQKHVIEKHRRVQPMPLYSSLQEERKSKVSSRSDQAHHAANTATKKRHQKVLHHKKLPIIRFEDNNDASLKTHHGHNEHHQHSIVEQDSINHHNRDHSQPILNLHHKTSHNVHQTPSSAHQPSQQNVDPRHEEKSHTLTIDQMNPIIKWTNSRGNSKVINLYGLYNLFVIAITLPIWLLSMEVLQRLGDKNPEFDTNRAKFDYSGKLWCRTYLKLIDSYPEIHGDIRRLQDKEYGDGRACLFVANHASFIDIAVLCTVLDPVFKFIAKDSLVNVPGVGKQLVGGNHVLIDRKDKRSQLRSFKQAINYLKDGVPIMAFPEGARSPDGRLMAFKPGLFSMAVKAKVPIVPLSIANTHAVMPSGVAFVPIQTGKGKLRVYVHDPIEVEGKSEEEISTEVKEALLSQLPKDQHPLNE